MASSNLTNKYNPQELRQKTYIEHVSSNLTNKYNPQERFLWTSVFVFRSNLTNKYNPQEHKAIQKYGWEKFKSYQ